MTPCPSEEIPQLDPWGTDERDRPASRAAPITEPLDAVLWRVNALEIEATAQQTIWQCADRKCYRSSQKVLGARAAAVNTRGEFGTFSMTAVETFLVKERQSWSIARFLPMDM
jgi:hypothetical protein